MEISAKTARDLQSLTIIKKLIIQDSLKTGNTPTHHHREHNVSRQHAINLARKDTVFLRHYAFCSLVLYLYQLWMPFFEISQQDNLFKTRYLWIYKFTFYTNKSNCDGAVLEIVTTSYARHSQFEPSCGHSNLWYKQISSMTPSQFETWLEVEVSQQINQR